VTHFLIRVDSEVPPALLDAFPRLACEVLPAQTVLTGTVDDQAELTGVLNHLSEVGVEVVEVVQIPD
jgi:hypothetical protein